jgi:hypothetical protein
MAADLSDLDVRPADPSVRPNTRVEADPETLKQLSAKAADAAQRERGKKGLSRWMDKARQLESNLQDQVTGREQQMLPPIHLRGVNKPGTPPSDRGQSPQAGQAPSNANSSSPNSGNGSGSQGESDSQPPMSLPGEQADQLAQNAPGIPAPSGPNQAQSDPNQMGRSEQGGPGSVAGANHSGGSDPEHLFGAPAAQELGSDSFSLTIDALPSDETSAKGAPDIFRPKSGYP